MKNVKVLFLVLVTLTSLACTTAEIFSKPTPTPLPSQTFTPSVTFTPTWTGTPTIQPPGTPEPGYSNLYGRVLWRGEPVAGFTMQLLVGQEVDRSVITKNDGRFTFYQLKGGDYTLRGYIKNSELAGIAAVWEDKLAIPDHENYNYGEYWLLEPDMVLLEPEQGSETNETQPSVSWEAYPGAAYYRVLFSPKYGEYDIMSGRITDLEYTAQTLLQACFYFWDVIAFDETGIPLARSNAYYQESQNDYYQYYDRSLLITNDETSSCEINLVSPDYGAAVSLSQVVFQWNVHPYAVRYRLYLLSCGAKLCGILSDYGTYDYILQEDGSLMLLDEPPTISDLPGNYRWFIRAYDGDGRVVAESRKWDFSTVFR